MKCNILTKYIVIRISEGVRKPIYTLIYNYIHILHTHMHKHTHTHNTHIHTHTNKHSNIEMIV